MFTFATMRKHRPVLLHSGDTAYARRSNRGHLADGKIWKNVTIPEKAKVAETLDEFRAAHKYNFLDDNLRAFQRKSRSLQWTIEVTNWSASKQLPAAYRERDINLLAQGIARIPRNVSDARKHRGAGRFTAPSVTARILTCSCWTSAAILGTGEPADGIRPRSVLPRPRSAQLAEARAVEFTRDMESHRFRHAAFHHRL
jgi:hypothetical protein